MIFVICILGVALIAYARQSQEQVSALDTAKQNYYTAFGIYKCDDFVGSLPAVQDVGADAATLKAGAYIESAGVIRWEPQVLSGERRLLNVGDLSSNLDKLRKMFDMLEQKSVLMQLLDVSSHADGIQIFIGGESDLLPYEDLAVISSPYSVDGQIVGTLGVIGPTRMAYDRVIPIVDITSKLLSGALSS